LNINPNTKTGGRANLGSVKHVHVLTEEITLVYAAGNVVFEHAGNVPLLP
jgi:hypothetical protein